MIISKPVFWQMSTFIYESILVVFPYRSDKNFSFYNHCVVFLNYKYQEEKKNWAHKNEGK